MGILGAVVLLKLLTGKLNSTTATHLGRRCIAFWHREDMHSYRYRELGALDVEQGCRATIMWTL